MLLTSRGRHRRGRRFWACSFWGLGHNGHIGFNEPAPEFPGTHCVELTESTINANSRLFDSIDDVPGEAYTMGIGTIMAAIRRSSWSPTAPTRPISLAASSGSVTLGVWRASILQFHPDATVVVERGEAGASASSAGSSSVDRIAPPCTRCLVARSAGV